MRKVTKKDELTTIPSKTTHLETKITKVRKKEKWENDAPTAIPMSFSNSQAWSKHWKWDTHEQKSSEHVDILKLVIPVVLSFATLTSPSRGYWWNPEIGVLKFLNVSKLAVVVWSNKNGRKKQFVHCSNKVALLRGFDLDKTDEIADDNRPDWKTEYLTSKPFVDIHQAKWPGTLDQHCCVH